ncbi:DNA end-binding protein Ku [Verrucomicrobium sp. GAS474]|nr:DNA end-binding protein Ku [Verrucomicrobium sp. GAS474]
MWKGSISFGLVTIPVALYPATSREELTFRLLRKTDQSPVSYKRVAQADGKEVPWENIVKGYEYEKGKFVVLKEEDFKRVDLEAAAGAIDIIDFVEVGEINPMYFQKPYYLEPQKGGDKAYALLREALRDSGKMGVAKVVIRTREHLAGVKAQGDALILEVMHFGDELVDADRFKLPKAAKARPREVEMAKKLVAGMTVKWDPDKYEDEYKTQLMAMIEEKVKHPDKKRSSAKAEKRPSNVIDLMSVLQESLSHTKGHGKVTGKAKGRSERRSVTPKKSHVKARHKKAA